MDFAPPPRIATPLSARPGCRIRRRENANYDGAYSRLQVGSESQCLRQCVDRYPACVAVDFNTRERSCHLHRVDTGVGRWQRNSCCNRYEIICRRTCSTASALVANRERHTHGRAHTHTHTHTHPFSGPFSGTTRVSRYQKCKPVWISLKQETVNGSGFSWAVCKSAPRSRQITTPAPYHSVFTGRMPFLTPNQQRQCTEGKGTERHTCAENYNKTLKV